MLDKFAVFILTHGRADNVVTAKTLKKCGYTGKTYFVVDNEDDQIDLYRKNFGADNVIVFDKQAAYDRTDSMDNFNNHLAIVYARNESYRIAEDLELTHFLMLDDDYTDFQYRYVKDGTLAGKSIRDLDRLFTDVLVFLDVSGAKTVALSQGGDFLGGIRGANYWKGLMRKSMNAFFCRTDRRIDFRGTMNEDVVTYTTLGSRGELFLSSSILMINQLASQSMEGGMTEVYKESGTYVKSFYAVMSMPSAVQVGMIHSKHKRMHHHINWTNTAPKILNERWRKCSE